MFDKFTRFDKSYMALNIYLKVSGGNSERNFQRGRKVTALKAWLDNDIYGKQQQQQQQRMNCRIFSRLQWWNLWWIAAENELKIIFKIKMMKSVITVTVIQIRPFVMIWFWSAIMMMVGCLSIIKTLYVCSHIFCW